MICLNSISNASVLDPDGGSMTVYSTVVPKVGALGARVAIGLCLAIGGGAGVAYAQQCGCSVPLSSLPAGQSVGRLSALSGSVNVLGANGWTPATAGTPLAVGSQIETGPGSSATLSVGGCSLNLGAQAAASLVASDQSLCVAVNNTVPGQSVGSAPQINPLVLGIAGGGAVAGIVAVATRDNDSPASP